MSLPVLRLLAGPTAAGKTEAALKWAEREGGEILSCDAVCSYRGLDVGSAKPTRAEQARVRHHGLDLAAPSQRFSIADYVRVARAVVEDCAARQRPLMIVGGSGFHLSAFLGPVADDLEITATVRREVERLQAAGREALHQRLLELEGGVLPTWLDVQNPLRLTKALERRLASGRALTDLRNDFLAKPGPFADFQVTSEVLDRPDEELRLRIAARTNLMLQNGILEEARLLLDLPDDLPAPRAVGYRETLNWLRAGGKGPLETLAQEINQSTWQLVGRQRKWFRRLGLSAN
jgi:tRNA dimethylallyltransferase